VDIFINNFLLSVKCVTIYTETAMRNFFIPTKENNYKPYLLKKVALVFYTILLVLVNTFGGVFGISGVSASSINTSNIISLTNVERSATGLNTLNNNSQLAKAAMEKAENMFEEQYWDHFGPNGETPWQFIIAAGYNYVYAGENLAKGFRTAEGVVEAWMASPTHRENILSKNYKDIGVAVKEGVLEGKQTILVVQMFGNLTNEVYGSNTNVPDNQVDPSPDITVIDKGQIKAISITEPKAGTTLGSSEKQIEGFVEGEWSDEYTVQIFDNGEQLTELDSQTVEWQYSSSQTWEGGDHNLTAGVKGTSIISEEIPFDVDLSPPNIKRDTLLVKRLEDAYEITFETDEDWYEIRIVNGSSTLSFLNEQKDSINLTNFIPSDSVVLYIYDEYSNSSQIDISEYFLEGETEEFSNLSWSLLINSLGTTDGITILIASFILLLIIVEIFILWKKGKLGKNIADLFVIALWITILSVGIFKGFGGVSL
jgi:uncharacterized protein YkwD